MGFEVKTESGALKDGKTSFHNTEFKISPAD